MLFAVPDEATETNRFEIAIPNGASLLITHSLDGRFAGLKDFPREDRPPVWGPFFAFRVMVGIGVVMIALALWGAWLWWRGRLEDSRLFLRLVSLSWPLGFIAIIAGWTVAEVGRQPWIATGILRTADAASPVPAQSVATTLILFVVVYGIVFAAGIVYINRLIRRGPMTRRHELEGVPNRPLSAARRGRLERWRVGRWRAISRSSGRVLIAAAVGFYVVLDGFDLGVGILFPFARREEDRDTMMNVGRAVLGRQRDLAGARRRRPAGSPSPRPMR